MGLSALRLHSGHGFRGDIATHCPRPRGRGRRPKAGRGGGYMFPYGMETGEGECSPLAPNGAQARSHSPSVPPPVAISPRSTVRGFPTLRFCLHYGGQTKLSDCRVIDQKSNPGQRGGRESSGTTPQSGIPTRWSRISTRAPGSPPRAQMMNVTRLIWISGAPNHARTLK